MVAGGGVNNRFLERVAEIYNWLDSQISRHGDLAGRCEACGKCCDFGNPALTCEQEPAVSVNRWFDHHLFVTTPELMYLAANLGSALTAETAESAEKKDKNKNKIKRSDNTKNLGVLCDPCLRRGKPVPAEAGSGKRKMGRCPYNVGGKCTVYEYRFAGCRIFCCNADADFQSRLSESAIKKFKDLCTEFSIPYRYIDLPTALTWGKKRQKKKKSRKLGGF